MKWTNQLELHLPVVIRGNDRDREREGERGSETEIPFFCYIPPPLLLSYSCNLPMLANCSTYSFLTPYMDCVCVRYSSGLRD
jgi:hypothetical protein